MLLALAGTLSAFAVALVIFSGPDGRSVSIVETGADIDIAPTSRSLVPVTLSGIDDVTRESEIESNAFRVVINNKAQQDLVVTGVVVDVEASEPMDTCSATGGSILTSAAAYTVLLPNPVPVGNSQYIGTEAYLVPGGEVVQVDLTLNSTEVGGADPVQLMAVDVALMRGTDTVALSEALFATPTFSLAEFGTGMYEVSGNMAQGLQVNEDLLACFQRNQQIFNDFNQRHENVVKAESYVEMEQVLIRQEAR